MFFIEENLPAHFFARIFLSHGKAALSSDGENIPAKSVFYAASRPQPVSISPDACRQAIRTNALK